MASFGRYEIISELGRGGMAQVFYAHDPQFDRDVAVKVLPREFLHDPKFLARFQREARALASLQHKGIVPVYDLGEEDGQPYLVMAHMAGGSLADRIQSGPLSIEESVRIIGQIAPALDHAHTRGLIHRDIKPENILFDEFGDAHISDFGIVRLSEATSQLTGAGILGTPAYLAPEMADSAEPTAMVDIYALGVTLFRMLTGKLPYEATTPIGLMTAHVTKPIPDIRSINPFLPPGIQHVIERSIAKDPTERYPVASDMLTDLQQVAAGEFANTVDIATVPNIPQPAIHATSDAGSRGTMPIEKKPSPQPPSGGGRRGWVFGVIGLVAIAAVVGVFLLLNAEKLFGPAPDEPLPPENTAAVADARESVVILVNDTCSPPLVTQADNIILRMRWGSTVDSLLADNIKTMSPKIILDGRDLGDITPYEQPFEFYSTENEYGCGSDRRTWYVHWDVPVGSLNPGRHIIAFNYDLAKETFDGFDTFPAGPLFEDDVEFTFDVSE